MRDIPVLLFSLFMTRVMVKLVLLQLFKKCWAKAEVANTTRAKVNFFRINHYNSYYFILHHLLYTRCLSSQQFFRLWTVQPTVTICRLRSPGERPCESFIPSAVRHQHALHNGWTISRKILSDPLYHRSWNMHPGCSVQWTGCNWTDVMSMANDWSSVYCFLLIERKEVTHQRTYI